MAKIKMLLRVAIVTVLVALTIACHPLREQEVVFIAYNVSNDRVVLVIGAQEWEIPANGSTRITTTVLVPSAPYTGSTGGPSIVDRTVQVSIAFRNLRTGRLTTPILCQSGRKVVVNVWYEMFSGYDGARCSSSF
ncbi:MAG: hypothetical protein ABL917_02080 [Parcubacteria group bacterium]